MSVQTQAPLRVRFGPRRLGHANIFVGDLERSMTFYNTVVGLDEVCRETGIEAGFLTNGNTHHDVGCIQASGVTRIGRDGHVQVSGDRGSRPGLNHFGLEMENEAQLVAAYLRATQAGLPIHRTTDHQLSHSIYVFDPEGNLLEFYADMLKEWWTVFKPETDLISGQWDPTAATPTSQSFYHPSPEIREVVGAVFRPLRISHAALVVRDFGTMLAFYTDVAGLDEVRAATDRAWAVLRGQAATHALTLLPETPTRPTGLHHMGFEMKDDRALDEALARARGAGIEPELVLEHPTKRAVFIKDPDGMRIEFAVEREAAFARRRPGDEDVVAFLG
jgi:catechol 2,3-dioxygenase